LQEIRKPFARVIEKTGLNPK